MTPAAAPRLAISYNDQEVLVDREGFVIGRGRNPIGLRIKDPNVSRQHALVEYQGGVYYLVDLGSVNGVEVNGERVSTDTLNRAWQERQAQYAQALNGAALPPAQSAPAACPSSV